MRHIGSRWPRVRILLRADSGCAREGVMFWCERNRVDDLFGVPRNKRLEEESSIERAWAEEDSRATGQPARRFKDVRWTTRQSWSRRRRVIGKAEWPQGEGTPRFIVTSLKPEDVGARELYERIYCARGEAENRITECPLERFADRASAATLKANQVRLGFAAMAYVLLCALRRSGLAHTQVAAATCGTLRLRLVKIGALVRSSVRRVSIAMASGFPGQQEFALAHARFATAG